MMATDVETCLVTGLGYVPTGRAVPNPLWNHYRAGDGKWFHLVMLQADRYWPRFCAAVGRPECEKEERFAHVVARAGNSVELIALLDELFASRTRDEWAGAFDRHDLVWAQVQVISDVVGDPQAAALQAFAEVPHRGGDPIRVVRSPVEFAATPATTRRCAPELGEHTEEVLLEHGYSWEEIAKLKEEGAIG